MKHAALAHLVPDVAHLAGIDFTPSIPLPLHAVPPRAPLKTFADVDKFIRQHPGFAKNRDSLRSICRNVAARVRAILAGERNEPFELNPKKLDLTTVPFDISMINAAWKDRSYRAAGFASKKSFRNARWAIRHIGRVAGLVVPHHAPPIPPDDPFKPLEQTADKYDKPTVRHFRAWCRQAGLNPPDVTNFHLIAYGTHMTNHMVGKRSDETTRLIARLWNATAQREAGWPQPPLSAPSRHERYTLPFTAYPISFQSEIVAFEGWMAGTKRRNISGRRPARKRASRPSTIKLRLYSIRLAAWALVAQGRDPASITDLDCLITEANAEAALIYYEDRAKARQQALPESDRVHNSSGTNVQTENIGKALVMIGCYREIPPEALKALKTLSADFRVPPPSKPTLKNRRRLDQLLCDRAKLKRLMRLPRSLMDEALVLRDRSLEALHAAGETSGGEAARWTHAATVLAREAAYRAREAVAVGILCRIPLRIKNLHEIRVGTHLQFSGSDSTMVILRFTEAETKNEIDLQFYVGPRLHALLRTYIELFLPFFAAKSADFAENRWLFPSGGHRRGSGPLSIYRLRTIIERTVAENVGVKINPHLFRALAVTLALEHSPDALEHCRLLLGDRSLTVVLRHYAMLKEMDAARRQSIFVDLEEDRLIQASAPRPLQRGGHRP